MLHTVLLEQLTPFLSFMTTFKTSLYVITCTCIHTHNELASCFSRILVCVTVHDSCVCVWRSGDSCGGEGSRQSCFALISFACNRTTRGWLAMRLEMNLVWVLRKERKRKTSSPSFSISLCRLTHSRGAAVHASVKTRGSELTGGPNWLFPGARSLPAN